MASSSNSKERNFARPDLITDHAIAADSSGGGGSSIYYKTATTSGSSSNGSCGGGKAASEQSAATTAAGSYQMAMENIIDEYSRFVVTAVAQLKRTTWATANNVAN